MDSIRTFIAVELEKNIEAELIRIQDILKGPQADVKWVKPSNIHITLKFLGEVSLEKIEKISQAIRDSASSFKPFLSAIENLSAFPNLKMPRVIWVDVVSQDNALEKLADLIETNLVSLDFAKEKRSFKSHVTIGRVRSSKNKLKLARLLEETKVERKEMLIQTLTLFKSTLSPSGPTYERLSSIQL